MCLGIPGQIVELIDHEQLLAKVDINGVQRPVNIACILDEDQPLEDCIGDWVLVHVGFAMSRIDAEEARKTLELLAEIGELQQEMEALQSQSTS